MILDQTQLSEIQETLRDNFPTLLDLFFCNSEIQIQNICKWDSISQNPTVMIAAHTLKSSAANLGLNQLASQCGLIETACNEDQDLSELISNFESLYSESITALKEATSIQTA